MTILLKQHSKAKGQPITPSAFVFGNNGYIRFGDKIVCGERMELISKLKELIKALAPNIVGKSGVAAIVHEWPSELDNPETAWPWLLENRPELFTGINLKSEPYAHYLEKPQEQSDIDKCRHLVNPTQADIAEALFGDRTKTGGSYRRRILKVLDKLATTTSKTHTTRPNQQKRAA